MLHARADVPVGSFLSGGYDSSAIAYLLAKNNYRPQTFSIGFNNWEKSEDQYAAVVAEKFGLSSSSTNGFRKRFRLGNLMPDVYDEPIADISILPTYLVSKNARKYVKAVMGGEGADELLGGYTWQKDWFREHPATWKQKLFGLSDNHQETLIPYYANAMAMGYFDPLNNNNCC
jgi:asparagine synthase (glutamine-hydrolysing)